MFQRVAGKAGPAGNTYIHVLSTVHPIPPTGNNKGGHELRRSCQRGFSLVPATNILRTVTAMTYLPHSCHFIHRLFTHTLYTAHSPSLNTGSQKPHSTTQGLQPFTFRPSGPRSRDRRISRPHCYMALIYAHCLLVHMPTLSPSLRTLRTIASELWFRF